MRKISVLVISLTYFSVTYNQCIPDKYYNYYHSLIQNEKDNIQKVFDGILDKYGNIDDVLEDLLLKLNKTIDRADLDLSKIENFNTGIDKTNNDSDTNLESLLGKLNAIELELKSINISRELPEDIKNAEKSSNKTVLTPVISDIMQQEEELQEWDTFLKNLIVLNNYPKSIMIIPHTVSDELTLLEKLMTKESDTSCFHKFHNDLKLLFIELANLFDFDMFQDDLNRIKAMISKNKQGADGIVSDTNKFIENENKLKDIHRLTNETLQLAEKIEGLKKSLDQLSGHNEEIVNERLEKLKKDHENELRKLDEKYNLDEGILLLNKLETTKRQIEKINIEDVEKDIDNYIRDINYYTCVLEKCEKVDGSISDCKRED